MKTSLLSVTFRKMSIEEIAALAAQGGVDAIEWGSDVHVPAGDRDAADRAVKACKAHGLAVSAYGSYCRCAEENFADYIATAKQLGTNIIRVWAGNIDHSSTLSAEDRAKITAYLKNAVAMAAKEGITVATEYHPNTLTDTLESTQQLLADVPGLYTYWQAKTDMPVDVNLAEMKALGKKAVNLHAFYFDENHKRQPFAAGKAAWSRYLSQAKALTDAAYVGLEFVLGGTAEQFLEDAKALTEVLAAI